MTDEQIAAVREKIACIICSWTTPDVCAYPCQRDIPHSICSIALQKVDIILALPNIAVLDENQELPENPHRDYNAPILGQSPACYAYQESQKDMLKEGWKKVLK